MENKFTEVMKQRTDSDLIKIIGVERDDYQPEAVSAAEIEVEKRGISNVQKYNLYQVNEEKYRERNKKANEGLMVGLKIFAFSSSALIIIIFAGLYKADGYDRKAKELAKWTLIGLGFKLFLGFIFFSFNN